MPANWTHTSYALQFIERRCDVGALVRFGHMIGDDVGHGVPVAGNLDVVLLKLREQVGVPHGSLGIDRRGRWHLEASQGLDHPEDADAIAIVALAERSKIRVGGASEATGYIGRDEMVRCRLHLIVLDTNDDPNRNTCGIGPAQRWT